MDEEGEEEEGEEEEGEGEEEEGEEEVVVAVVETPGVIPNGARRNWRKCARRNRQTRC